MYRFIWTLSAFLAATTLTACGASGSDNGPASPSLQTVVQFVYQAPTSTDPTVAANFMGCVSGVGFTHIHPSWRNFDRIALDGVAADRWEIVFSDVPVGSEQRIRISDPNACDTDLNGASTDNVFANGVRLTRIVDTPGNGIEPGLAFSADAAGVVTP